MAHVCVGVFCPAEYLAILSGKDCVHVRDLALVTVMKKQCRLTKLVTVISVCCVINEDARLVLIQSGEQLSHPDSRERVMVGVTPLDMHDLVLCQ